DLNKFFENVLQAFLKHVDFEVVHCAMIASPGSVSSSLIVGGRKKTAETYYREQVTDSSCAYNISIQTGHSPSRIELFDITHMQANGQAVNEPTQDALADAELKEEVKHLKSMLEQQAIQMAEQRRHFEDQQASQMVEQRAHYDNIMMQMLSYITSQLFQSSSDH
ncbi:protein pelota 2, partial [Quercus suber]